MPTEPSLSKVYNADRARVLPSLWIFAQMCLVQEKKLNMTHANAMTSIWSKVSGQNSILSSILFAGNKNLTFVLEVPILTFSVSVSLFSINLNNFGRISVSLGMVLNGYFLLFGEIFFL